jgi:hypothetical protein
MLSKNQQEEIENIKTLISTFMHLSYGLILKSLGLIRYFTPVDNFIRNRIIGIFWNKTVFPICEIIQNSSDISQYISLKQALNEYPARALINSIFYDNERRFTNLDVAVALYISMHAYINPNLVDKEKVVAVSAIFTKLLIENLRSSKLYKNELKRIDKDRKLFDYKIHRDIVKETLFNNKKLFTHHFKSYEEQSFPDFLRVWHPKKGQSWIDWNMNDSIRVHIDSTKVPEGFFLVGFDYSNRNNNFLKIAVRKNGYEYFNREVKNGKIVWIQ